MAKDLFLDVQQLERRKVHFDTAYEPNALNLPDNWNPADALRVQGAAELLDRRGARTIRVRGRIGGTLRSACARCLAALEERFDDPFELFFYPASMLNQSRENAVNSDDADIGFYEDAGLPLGDAVREQIVLWLPMRGLCRDDCRGLCSHCGGNRNEVLCSCEEQATDPRWEALKNLRLNG